MNDDFLQILQEHIRRYPFMEPQDFGKLAYQSEFGPEHLIADRQQAKAFLIEEWSELPKSSAAQLPEAIGSTLCRFPLSACLSADAAALLADLFVFTAGAHQGSREGLEEKLKQIEGMEIAGITEWMAKWRRKGCPPVHHSKKYRERYNPHYRLVLKECADYFDVLFEIYRLMEKENPIVIAIDGRCGSGKTHLAELIGKLFSCNVLHMDDFYLPFDQRPENWRELPAGNMDLQRFLTEVLRPIRSNKQVFYRPYSCSANHMEEAVQLTPHKLTVVEGSYSHHPLLAAEYDLTIFLTCAKEEQKKRLQIREGDYFPVFEKQWIPMEENYLRYFSIEENSHLVVDTGRFFCSAENLIN